jgi:dihydropteroate synthase type 2
MGFFLGDGPGPSLAMLRQLPRLRQLGLPLLVSVSRKSFLGAVTGRDPAQRASATLAAEVWAVLQGVDYIRTHEPAPLRDALLVLGALGAIGAPVPPAVKPDPQG